MSLSSIQEVDLKLFNVPDKSPIYDWYHNSIFYFEVLSDSEFVKCCSNI